MKYADYYGILSETTDLYRNRHFDFTPWIKWHLQTTLAAIKKSLKESTFIIERGQFWEKHQSLKLNDRESQCINAMFDALSKGKIESFTTKEYMTEYGVARSTARRDINALVRSNMIARIKYAGERYPRYILKTDETSDLEITSSLLHEENRLYAQQSKSSQR